MSFRYVYSVQPSLMFPEFSNFAACQPMKNDCKSHWSAFKCQHLVCRWHPLIIKWCLRIKLKSPGSYEEMAKSGIVILPSSRLLKSYTQSVEQHSGIVEAHMRRVEQSAAKLEGHQRNLILLFDEMKVSLARLFSPIYFFSFLQLSYESACTH